MKDTESIDKSQTQVRRLKSESFCIVWLRRDLRLKDNAALAEALSSELPVLPLFIFDPQILDRLNRPHDLRVQFIYEELKELDEELKVSHQAGIRIFYGEPREVWEQILAKHNISSVFYNRDYEHYARDRDEEVELLFQKEGVNFQSFKDHLILEPGEVLKDDGSPYSVFTPFSKKWKNQLRSSDLKEHKPSSQKLNYLSRKHPIFEKFEDQESEWSFEDLGFERLDFDFPGKNLKKQTLKEYKKLRDFPAEEGTSLFGLHFRFGTISPRQAVKVAQKESETWLNELIWREFFQHILYFRPDTVDQPFHRKYLKVQWRKSKVDFDKWCRGETGYPLVDAGMRELNETGHMHNRVRMLTASFLCKHLFLPWQWGERYFAQKLLDFELASNVGNWQWAAGCGCDAAPYFRIFNPQTQMEKFDPDGEYVKKWVPEFESEKYVAPMIDHKKGRERALEGFKRALKTDD